MRIERVSDTCENLKAATGLIDAAGRWLRTKDTDQWAEPWPPGKRRDERVRRDLAAGKTWFVRDRGDAGRHGYHRGGGHPARVDRQRVPICLEPAVYVHRLVTARDYAGLGLGAQLIDWAGRRGQSRYGAKWIRIDVWTTNTDLHQYYERSGSSPAGSVPISHYPSGALFQKSVADIERDSPSRT